MNPTYSTPPFRAKRVEVSQPEWLKSGLGTRRIGSRLERRSRLRRSRSEVSSLTLIQPRRSA
jgi:hypothetical protein